MLPFISSNTTMTLLSSQTINLCQFKNLFVPSMETEEGKQSPHKNPYTQLEEVSSDFVLAIGLQEQDGTFPSLESESESDSSSFDNDYDREADFFLSQEIESDLQFLESEGSNDDYDEDIEADDIDVDEMTYEELIELGDFMGKEKTGLSAIEISSCLHSAEIKSGIDKCVICQVEYEDGEALVALQCEHPYHTDCISKWLQVKKVCPICSTEISVPNMVNKNP